MSSLTFNTFTRQLKTCFKNFVVSVLEAIVKLLKLDATMKHELYIHPSGLIFPSMTSHKFCLIFKPRFPPYHASALYV